MSNVEENIVISLDLLISALENFKEPEDIDLKQAAIKLRQLLQFHEFQDTAI